MKKTTKRLLAAVLCLVMVLGALPLTALAEAGIAPMSLLPDTTKVDTYVFMNGETTVSTQRLKAGEELLEPATPSGATAADHFVGWKDASGNTPTFDTVSSVSGATHTYTAQWEQACYVYFMADVAGGANENVVLATEKVTPDGKVSLLPTDSSVESWGDFTTDTVVTGDTVVRPVLKEGYWVTFDSQGGSVISSVHVQKDDTLTLDDSYKPTRAGYTFDGWLFSNNEIVTSITPESDVTLYAVWSPAQVGYTVVYWGENADDEYYSVLATESKTANAGEAITFDTDTAALPSGTKDAEHFVFGKSDTVIIDGNGASVVNVYFERKTYTLTFVTGTSGTPTCGQDENHRHSLNGGCYDTGTTICGKVAHEHNRWGCGLGFQCGKEEHTHGWWCDYPCSKEEHSHIEARCSFDYLCGNDEHRHNNECYKLTCTKEENHTHTAECYDNNDNVIAIVSEKYDADISEYWESGTIKSDYLDKYHVFESSATQKYYSYLLKMPGQNITMTDTDWSKKKNTYTWDYYLEVLRGQSTQGLTTKTDKSGKTYYLYHTSTAKADSINLTYDEDYFPITGFKQRDSEVPVFYDRKADLYYTREKFNLKMYNYSDAPSTDANILYEASLSSYETTPTRPASVSANAVFKGWYTVEPDKVTDTTVAFNFSQTMPAKNLVLYAYWEEQPVNLKIEFSVSGVTVEDNQASYDVGTVISSTSVYKKAIDALTVKKLGVDHWEDEQGNRVNVNDQLGSNLSIHPVLTSDNTSYHVYYKTSADATATEDTYTYRSGAAAEAKSGSDISGFLYWQGSDCSIYYPGSQIDISDADVTLTAVCGETRGTTTLTYHANFTTDDSTATLKHSVTVDVNAEHTVLTYNETGMTSHEGCTFLGWSTVASATSADTAYAPNTKIIVDNGTDAPTNDLYAIWAADITVTFVVKNGIWGGKSGDETTSFTVTIPYDTALETIPTATAATGYQQDSGSWTGTEPDTSTQLTQDTTYTYTFNTQIKYKVTYKVDNVQVGNVDEYTYGAEVTVREKYEKTDYTVTDWQIPTSITVTNGKFSMPAEDVVITATSSINTASYTINYYLDDVLQGNDTETGTANISTTVSASKIGNYSNYLEYPANQTKMLTISSDSNANVLNLYYYTDNEGGDNGGDDFPDIYEKKVTFKIVNGTWDGNNAADKKVWVKLYKDGKASADGSGSLTAPTGMQPNSNYDASSGAWDTNPPTTVTGTDGVTYTYRYSTALAPNLTVTKTVYSIKRGDNYIYGTATAAGTGNTPYVQTDDEIVWQIKVENTGNAAGSVTLVDKLNDTTSLDIYKSNTDWTDGNKVSGAQTVNANATVYYYAKYTVLSTDTGTLTNSVKVNDNNELVPSTPINVGQPNLSVTKGVHSINGKADRMHEPSETYSKTDIQTAKVGDEIIWVIEVTNTGTAEGTFTLTDELLGENCVFYATYGKDTDKCVLSDKVEWPQTIAAPNSDTGAVGEHYYVKYTVQPDDLGKTLVNTVVMNDKDGKKINEDDAPGVPVGGLTVDKAVKGINVDKEEIPAEDVPSVATHADTTYSKSAKVGDTITWTITVKNYFDTEQTFTLADVLSNGGLVQITPPAGVTADTNGDYHIDAATVDANKAITPATLVFTATYVVQAFDEGKTLVNKAKVTPSGSETPIEDDADGVKVDGKLSVAKKVYSITRGNDEIYHLEEGANNSVPEAKIGDKITWIIWVTNSGNKTICYTLADVLKGGTDSLTIYNQERTATIAANAVQTLQPRLTDENVLTSNVYYVDYTVKTSDYGKELINVVTATEKNEDGTNGATHPAESNPVKVEDKPNTPSYNPNYNAGVQLEKGEHFNYVIGYSDGTVRPEGNITRAEVATIFFRLLTDESRKTYLTEYNTFTDVEKSMWHNVAISTLARAGVLNGYNDGSFRPNNYITRAEMAAIISRFAELEGSTRISFTDIRGHWAEKSILLAASNGWINGYNDGSFRPDQNITRAETFAMINRVLERKVEHVEDLVKDMNTWVDNMDTTQWYYFDVQEATNYHSYQRKYTNTNAEKWIKKLTDIDWTVYQY